MFSGLLSISWNIILRGQEQERVAVERTAGKPAERKERSMCACAYIFPFNPGLSFLWNSSGILGLYPLINWYPYISTSVCSHRVLPRISIQSLSLINFPKNILDTHPPLFKTIASPYPKMLEPLNWHFPWIVPLPLLFLPVFFVKSTGMLFLFTLYPTSFNPILHIYIFSYVFYDSTNHTLNLSCVTFIIRVLFLLISVFLGRIHAPWEQGPWLSSSLPFKQRLLIKCLLNEWMSVV